MALGWLWRLLLHLHGWPLLQSDEAQLELLVLQLCHHLCSAVGRRRGALLLDACQGQSTVISQVLVRLLLFIGLILVRRATRLVVGHRGVHCLFVLALCHLSGL